MSCGFHGWTYNLDGDLIGIPKHNCLDIKKEDTKLDSIPIIENQGLLLVGLGKIFQLVLKIFYRL